MEQHLLILKELRARAARERTFVQSSTAGTETEEVRGASILLGSCCLPRKQLTGTHLQQRKRLRLREAEARADGRKAKLDGRIPGTAPVNIKRIKSARGARAENCTEQHCRNGN